MTLPEPIAVELRELQLTPEAFENAPGVAIRLPGDEAFGVWRRLARVCRGNGFWPVILGEAQNIERLAEAAEFVEDDSPAQTLAHAATGDAEAAEAEPDVGEWPDEDEIERNTTPLAVADVSTGETYDEVVIAIIEAEHSWQVPAFLQYGNWNDCPEPALHVARHRDWHERFGSDICSVTADTIECVVTRPPTNRDDAMELAQEQYVYCYDIVEQGTQTLRNLAAVLVGSPLWFFWWD